MESVEGENREGEEVEDGQNEVDEGELEVDDERQMNWMRDQDNT